MNSGLAEAYRKLAEETLWELQLIPRWHIFRRLELRARRRNHLLYERGHRELDALMERAQRER